MWGGVGGGVGRSAVLVTHLPPRLVEMVMRAQRLIREAHGRGTTLGPGTLELGLEIFDLLVHLVALAEKLLAHLVILVELCFGLVDTWPAVAALVLTNLLVPRSCKVRNRRPGSALIDEAEELVDGDDMGEFRILDLCLSFSLLAGSALYFALYCF